MPVPVLVSPPAPASRLELSRAALVSKVPPPALSVIARVFDRSKLCVEPQRAAAEGRWSPAGRRRDCHPPATASVPTLTMVPPK